LPYQKSLMGSVKCVTSVIVVVVVVVVFVVFVFVVVVVVVVCVKSHYRINRLIQTSVLQETLQPKSTSQVALLSHAVTLQIIRVMRY